MEEQQEVQKCWTNTEQGDRPMKDKKEARNLTLYENNIRPTNQYKSWLTPAPLKPATRQARLFHCAAFSKVTSPSDAILRADDHTSNQFFDDILSCPLAKLSPDGPQYTRTHLRSIGNHFMQPNCWITTDTFLSRNTFHLSHLPQNYPWIFMINVYQKQQEAGLVLLSTRYFFRDPEGEVDFRPYVEITKEKNLTYVWEKFKVEETRTGMFFCQAKESCGHLEHWGRQYVVRFLKQKQKAVVEDHALAHNRGWSCNWRTRMPRL